MSFDIRDFSAELARRGTLKTNKFQMEMQLPPALLANRVAGLEELTDTARFMELYGEAAHLPGVALATTEVRRYGYGPFERKPYAPVFTDVPMSFREDAAGRIGKFFKAWLRVAVLYETREQGTNSTTGSVPGQYPYEIAYKSDYAQDVTIKVFDDSGAVASQVTLREAYPIFVGDVPLNWAAHKDVMKIPVVLTYFDFYSAGTPPQAAS